MTIFGINDHFLSWAEVDEYPITDLVKLGVKVCRNDLITGPDSGYPGEFGSALCVKTVSGWAAALRAAGIQPMIVVTFDSLLPTTEAAQAMRKIAKAVPGLCWEWGNEIHYQAPSVTAAQYVKQFKYIAHAVHDTDPTAKIGPEPVANINPGGDGWQLTEECFAAGLGKINYDFLPFHDYPWPTDKGPFYPFANGFNAVSLIPNWKTQCAAWGNHAPLWLTEWGWQSVDGIMTLGSQRNYCKAFWGSAAVHALPVAITYELGDGGGQTYGWMTAGWAKPKPVYTAFAKSNA
jgi:hypothetical protein